MMKKYPVKSNWISYKKNNDSSYTVRNHILDEEFEMTKDEIELIESLDGRTNPCAVLQSEFGMTRIEAEDYVDSLVCEGVLRQGNSVFGMLLMRTIIKIYDSSRYREIAIVLLGLILVSFLPVMFAGFRSACKIFSNYEMIDYHNPDGPVWLGIVIGIIGGLFFHELNHAIACCAFGGPVMEFGIAFRGFPSAYTLLDYKHISRCGQVITDLVGVVANLMLSAISMLILHSLGSYMAVFLMIAAVNLELALVNLLFIDGIDGCNAISKLLGFSDIYENCSGYLRKFKHKERKALLSERDKTIVNMFRVFRLGKLMYPILIAFNLCVVWGW